MAIDLGSLARLEEELREAEEDAKILAEELFDAERASKSIEMLQKERNIEAKESFSRLFKAFQGFSVRRRCRWSGSACVRPRSVVVSWKKRTVGWMRRGRRKRHEKT